MKVVRTHEVEVPNLGQNIKQARLNETRSLTEICAQVGMTTANWYRIESESQSLPFETLKKIEDVLEVDFGIEID